MIAHGNISVLEIIWTVLAAWSFIRGTQLMVGSIRDIRKVTKSGENSVLYLVALHSLFNGLMKANVGFVFFVAGLLAMLMPEPPRRTLLGWVIVGGFVQVAFVFAVASEVQIRIKKRILSGKPKHEAS